MSTLTTSPSLAGSPRFYSPQKLLSKSPRFRASQASSVANRTSDPLPRPSTSISRPQYADAGTQYSPEGSPPTAHERLSTNNKRKEPDSDNTSMTNSTSPVTAPEEPQLRRTPEEPPAAQPSVPSGGSDDVSPVGDEVASVSNTASVKRARTDADTVKIMPRQYETCNPKDLGVLIANMLLELIRLNDKIPVQDGRLTRFHSRAPPGISCHDYLNRLIQHATLSPPILLACVFYIDRLCALYPAFTINSLTVHRFLITSATVAAKGLSDSFWTNPVYARIGGISTSELATLEMDLLTRMEWRIVPKPETLVDYYNSLVQRSEGWALEDIKEDEQMPDPT